MRSSTPHLHVNPPVFAPTPVSHTRSHHQLAWGTVAVRRCSSCGASVHPRHYTLPRSERVRAELQEAHQLRLLLCANCFCCTISHFATFLPITPTPTRPRREQPDGARFELALPPEEAPFLRGPAGLWVQLRALEMARAQMARTPSATHQASEAGRAAGCWRGGLQGRCGSRGRGSNCWVRVLLMRHTRTVSLLSLLFKRPAGRRAVVGRHRRAGRRRDGRRRRRR